jgi:hypothetical protein
MVEYFFGTQKVRGKEWRNLLVKTSLDKAPCHGCYYFSKSF